MKCITIPCTPIYWSMIGDIEDIGLEVTDEIMSLCKQIEQELDKQSLAMPRPAFCLEEEVKKILEAAE